MFREKFSLLILLLFVKAILAACLILYSGVGLSPDEAQYWTWSKKLAWGYYSKPPGIAWQIRLGTFFFGDTEFGVRFGSLLLGTFLPIAVFFLAKTARLSSSISFWAALTMAFTPLGFLATFFAITDVGVVLFWTLALLPLIEAIEKEKTPNYPLFGLLVALGALFKWQIYWIWLLAAILFFVCPKFRKSKVIVAMLISLLGLLPSLYWNIHNEWATFRHVGATIIGAEESSGRGNFFDFLGAQTALASPIIFFLLLFSIKDFAKAKLSLKVLGGSFFTILAVHCFFAIFKKMQGNWCDYAYPAGFVYLAWFCQDKLRQTWLKMGISLSVILILTVFVMQKYGWIPYRVNPFRHNIGWSRIEETLLKAGYQPGKDFLFAGTYQTTSILNFYTNQKAYFFNINGLRKNQFSFWPQMEDNELDKNGFFVVIDSEQKLNSDLSESKLKPFFNNVEVFGIFPLYVFNNAPVKSIMLIRVIGYNGKHPYSINKY